MESQFYKSHMYLYIIFYFSITLTYFLDSKRNNFIAPDSPSQQFEASCFHLDSLTIAFVKGKMTMIRSGQLLSGLDWFRLAHHHFSDILQVKETHKINVDPNSEETDSEP